MRISITTASSNGCPAAAVYDLRKTLRAHGDEYIFYRTDHHWTSEGAYLAYEQFAGSKGLPLFDRSAADAKKVENFYGTSYSKARNYDVVPDTITYYDLPNQLTVYTANADGSESGETDRCTTPPILKHGTNIRHSCAATTVILFWRATAQAVSSSSKTVMPMLSFPISSRITPLSGLWTSAISIKKWTV